MSVNIVKTINGQKILNRVAGKIPAAFASLSNRLEINNNHELDIADGSIPTNKLNTEINNKISNIADTSDVYDETTNYAKDDIVIDTDYKLYKLKTDTYYGSVHPKDSSSWEQMSLTEYSNYIKDGLSSLNASFTKRTSGNWEYMVFPNGFKIMTYTASDTISNWVAWGVLYESNRIFQGISYPVAFNSAPNYSVATDFNITGFEGSSISSVQFNGFYVVRPDNNTTLIGSHNFKLTVWGW